MTFKSSINWPTQPDNLTTYQGDRPGRNQVRKAEMEAQGTKGIRRVDWKDAHGNSYTMNTRNGFPEVVCIPGEIAATVIEGDVVRGFVAHVPEAVDAARFSPYTLAVLDPKYRIFEHKYTVLPFETPYNVPTSDTTDWFDVISFYRGKILINGKEMTSLLIASPPVDALPWLIPKTALGEAKYGDYDANGYEKRVFAVYSDSVHSWMGGTVGTTVTLNNPSARPYKAMMCGAAIVPADHKAILSQMAFTGSAWDSWDGGWAFTTAEVSMLLTPPYLTKIDDGISAERSLCIPADTGVSAGTTESAKTLPACQVGLVGPCFSLLASGLESGSNARALPVAAWEETPEGYESTTYYRATYGGSVSESVSIGHETATVTASNVYYSGPNYSSIGAHLQSHNTGNGARTGTSNIGYESGNNLISPAGPQGATYWSFQEDNFGLPWNPTGPAYWDEKQTQGSFSIIVAGHTLAGGEFYRHIASGDTHALTKHDWASDYIAAGWHDLYYYTQDYTVYSAYSPGSPDFYAAQSAINSAASAWNGVLTYMQGDAHEFGYSSVQKYTKTITTRPDIDDRSLSWTTKDFILYDDTNACYISVDSVFTAAQSYGGTGVAALTVNLTIVTPAGTAVQTLFTTPIIYADLLPEQPLEYAYTYVPNPQLRVMFVPLYREQGDFKGAAYTTAEEVSNGAVAAHLFNFVLKLDTYYAVGENTSDYPTINFIPCNLLEMLYAYVYSGKYGVDNFQRYPVDNISLYNSFQASLFTNQWRVNYRDGALVDWLDTLGGPYMTETMTELYRT